jgi:hypothetical protein
MSDLKTRVRFPSTIKKVNLDGLRELSDETRIPMSKLIDEALEDLFKKYNKGGNTNETG